MSTLICTPAFGGLVTTNYLSSILYEAFMNPKRLKNQQKENYQLGLLTLSNESLIARARSYCVSVALRGGFDKVLFIDADAGFKWPDLQKLLDSHQPIIAGVCPLKSYPLSLNFSPFKQDEKYFPEGLRSMAGLKRMAEAYKTNEIPVNFVGTAFMLIDCGVFDEIKKRKLAGRYMYPDTDTGNMVEIYDFFPCGPNQEQDRYVSEDWGFCHLARMAGFEIKIHGDVCITHTGSHTFQIGSGVDLATTLDKPSLEPVASFKPHPAEEHCATEGEGIQLELGACDETAP